MTTNAYGKLIIIEGPMKGQEFTLEKEVNLIGRDQSMDIRIEHTVVSRQHARLTFQEKKVYIEDLHSSNGTYIEGQAVTNQVQLRSGDTFSLGHAVTLELVLLGVEEPDIDSAQATQLEADVTFLESNETATRLSNHPHLQILSSGQPGKSVALTMNRYTLGRGEDNDIILQSRIASRHHAVLERVGNGYQLIVLPEASNRMMLNHQIVDKPERLYDLDLITIESTVKELQVEITYSSPEEPRPAQPKPAVATLDSLPEVDIASIGVHDQTMLDANYRPALAGLPDQLIVTVAGNPPVTHKLVEKTIKIGRAEDNNIVVQSQIVSRHHAVLERVSGGYDLVILPDVINTMVCQGRPVVGRTRLNNGDVLRIDSDMPGMMVSMTYHARAEMAQPVVKTIEFGAKEKLTFGRDPSNDVQIDAPNVSRFHAQIERVGRRYRLLDLQSANGTFVNDQRVSGDSWLDSNASIRMGPYRFVLGENSLTRYDEIAGLKVEASGLQKFVRKDVNILKNISLVFQPREFIVVVGQSGGGKSTLVDAIAGYRPATHGRVMVNGIDVYKNFDAIRNEIGYVPQRDIIHTELTVYQALDYAAKLRMPRDTSQEERHKRILEVLDDLDLAHRKDTQISQLSGGQQKRVSIGVELLTKPGLFFLDEPTSGLDPGTETSFMHLMRRLADQGRTIILVTHATKNVMLADKVVFLARGGHLAWFGPPDEALKFFDQHRSDRERRSRPMEFDQIYAILDDQSKGSALDWEKRYQENGAYRTYIVGALASSKGQLPLASIATQTSGAPASKKKRVKHVSPLYQFIVLSARNIKILTRDRSSMVLMLIVAPLIACLDFVLAPMMGRALYDYQSGDPNNGTITLFLLTINCLLVAGLSQMREIVKEGEIYKRERLVNLQILPYVASKVWVALLLAFYHAAAYTIAHYLAFDMPGGQIDFWLFYGTMVLAAMGGMMFGLLASAMAPAASSAPLIIIMLLIPQIVLSGILAPVPGEIASIASIRWAFQGLIGITGIGSDIAADPCWQLSEEMRDAMDLDAKQAQGCRCMGLAVFQPGSCNFPGAGKYYKPDMDLPKPVEPPALGDKPAEPVIPEAPAAPADQFDQVAVAQYLNALQSYQDDVARIQDEYKNQMQLYEAQAKVYEEEMKQYQVDLTDWNVTRNSSTQEVEGLINSVNASFSWAWVNKNDPKIFWPWLMNTWLAQLILIAVIFALILFLMKRKDVK